MGTKLTLLGGSTLNVPPAAHSNWDSWSVNLLFGLGALGALGIAAVALKIISDSSSSPTPQPKTKEDPELIKFISEQHKSGLLSRRKTVCINEAKSLSFEQFAEGIIRFETADLSLKEGDEFFIRCSEYKSFLRVEPFFRQTAFSEEDLEFFLPNLPLKGRIKVEFGTSQQEVSLDLNIDQVRGIYTIFKEKLSYHSRSEALPSPIIRNPFTVIISGNFYAPSKHGSLEIPLSIRLFENNYPQIKAASLREKGHLIIKNSGERCVVYLQLTSGKHSIPTDQRDIVVPLVISAGKTKTVSKKMLYELWKNNYQWATSKTPLEGDLDLRLLGIHQMIYPSSSSVKKTSD